MYYSDMDTVRRQAEIIRRLRRDGRIDVADLAAAFATAGITIRRDLDQLAAQGVLRRVRGGAVNLLMRGDEPPFRQRLGEQVDAKRRIAERVGTLIRDGEAVAIDSGTTGLAVAQALAGRRLTGLPLSLPAAAALSGGTDLRLILPGGTVRPGEQGLIGPLTLASLGALRFDTAVLGCCGCAIDAGITAYDLDDAAVKRAMIAAANRTILVTDGAKFTRTAMAAVCPTTSVDVIVTDEAAPESSLAALREAGVEVHRV